MPLSETELQIAEALEERYRARIESAPDGDDYDDVSSKLTAVGNRLDEHYASLRKVDENGKLTEDAPGRLPNSVEGTDPRFREYFFEPSVREVQDFLRRDPGAMDRLGLRRWAEGEAVPAKREAVLDSMSGMPQGYNVVPAQTYLDTLTQEEEPYKKAADELWKQRMDEAQRSGKSIKRYRDVKFDEDEWGDYVAGGINKGLDRVVAPALMGAADAMTMGQAAPLGDAITDLADYELGKRGINLEDYAGRQPRSREVINRNMPAYVAGNLAGYSLPKNPTNLIQGGIVNAANYAERGIGGRLATAAVGGAVGNATESAVGDMARYANEGEPIPMGRVALNALGQAGIGAVGGAAFDAAAQGISKAREGYRGLKRQAPLRTLEEAGGEASTVMGVSPTDEIRKAEVQQAKDRLDDKKAPRTIAGRLSEDLAPEIKKSVEDREVANKERIGRQMEEYYAHPEYRDRKVSARVAVEGLIDMARRGIGRAPDGSPMPMNPAAIGEIGGILRNYSRSGSPVPRADAPALAHASGGVVVDGELANQLYGLKEGDIDYFRPGFDAVVRPGEINAEQLTQLEGRIDDELQFAKNKGAKDDPVWNRFNQSVKDMRDEFPAYRDADGNLVAPPPESVRPEPFGPAADLPRPEGRMSTLPRPAQVGAARRPQGEALPGVGGPQPALPDTFDPRAPKPQGAPADELPRAIGVGGEGMVARPEGLFAVGPGQPDLPNPFDPRLPTARETLNPQPTMDVQGEYGPPPPLDPNARMGVGDRFNPDAPTNPFAPAALSPVEPQPTQTVRGDYNRPPMMEPEPRSPITERNPYGFAARGEPPHETPLPPSERPRVEELTKDGEFNEKVYQQEYGPTTPAPKKPKELPPNERLPANMTLEEYKAQGGKVGVELPPEVQAKIDDGTLSTEAQQKELYGRGEAPKESAPPARTEAPAGKVFGIVDRSDGGVREKTFATAAEAKAEAKRLNDKFKSAGRFNVKKVDAPAAVESRSPLEKQLDAQLDSPDAPPVPKTEIEAAGARQTADREQVAENQKHYVEDLFAPGREARAAQVEKVRALGEHPEVIEEAIAAVKKVDERLGPLSVEQRREMVVGIIEKKLGRKIDAEDLIRFGLISAGLVQMGTDEDGGEAGAAVAGIGMFGFGRGKGPKAPAGPERPPKPTQPEYTLKSGKKVRGFSAMRGEQSEGTTAIERAMKRLGVEGDTTLENRIRTYGQLNDRGTIDQALLDEAGHINKQRELRNAAGANAYEDLKERRFVFFGNEGIAKGLLDFIGFRGYKAGEYFAGRHSPNVKAGDDGLFRNPYVQQPSTLLGEMQRTLLEDPARRLLNLSGGAPAARFGDDATRLYKGDEYYEDKDDKKRRPNQPRP